MNAKQYKKVGQLLKKLYEEMQREALDNGVNIASQEFTDAIDKAREAVLNKMGFTLQEYRDIKSKVEAFTSADIMSEVEAIRKAIKEVDEKYIPSQEEIKEIAHEVAKEYIKAPEIINKIVKEVQVRQPQIIKETRVELDEEELEEVKKDLYELQNSNIEAHKRLNEIKIPDIEEVENNLKQFFQDNFGKNLKDNIDILGMPDFRKLAMGLESRIAELEASGTGGSGTPGGSTTQLQYNSAGSFGGISGATSDGTNITFGSGNLLATDVKASGSGGVSILNSSGGTVADFGTGGSTNATIHGAINVGTDSADYIQLVGGTGNATENIIGSSTNIDKIIVPKGTGRFQVTGGSYITGTLDLGHTSDTTIARTSAGDITIEGNIVYRAGGTDVPVADGGTGLSSIAALSILVANSANTYVALTPGAGNSIRMNAGGTAWEAYTPSAGSGDMVLADAQSVTGLKTFDKDKLAMKGTSTGKTTISTANTGASDYTATLQAATGTIALTSDLTKESIAGLTTASSPQFTAIELSHATANTLAASGGHMTIEGATVWDSGNDGASSGLDADLLDGKNTGTSGNAVPLLDGTNTWSGLQTFSLAGVPVRIVNTTDGASVQVIKLEGDRATIAANDEGYASLILSDSAGNQDEQARITWKATTVTSGATQDGQIILSTLLNNSLTTILTLGGADTSSTFAGNLSIGTSNAFTAGTIELGAASDTTIARASAGVISVEGKNVYMAGGTDVALADGGTGASLTDPNADRIMFWDDSAGAVDWLAPSTGLTITTTNIAVDQTTAFAWTGAHTWTKAGVLNTLTNTTDNASVQVAILEGDRATMAANDEAYITLRLSDSGGNQDEQARITWKATTVTAGATQDGQLIFSTLLNNVLTTALTIGGATIDATFAGNLSVGTSNSFTTGTIELGATSDTTISRVSAGVIAVEGVNVLTTSTGLPLSGGTMTGNITLGENTAIALDPAGSADGKYSGITIAGTAGYAQAFGDLVYLSSADSRWELADADAATTADRMLAMVVVAGAADGNACTLLLQGVIRADAKFPALTIGSAVYVGETAGAIQVAIPTGADNVIRRVGYALTADEIYFAPSMDAQTTVA